MTLSHSGFSNDPFAGADNKPQVPPDSEGDLGSGTPPAGGSGPTHTRIEGERGKLVFQSPDPFSSRHPIEGETPEGFGPGASNGPY